MHLRSTKVVAQMNRPINSNLNANDDNLQAEPQAHRFSRVSDSATRRAFVCRAKRMNEETTTKYIDGPKLCHFRHNCFNLLENLIYFRRPQGENALRIERKT